MSAGEIIDVVAGLGGLESDVADQLVLRCKDSTLTGKNNWKTLKEDETIQNKTIRAGAIQF